MRFSIKQLLLLFILISLVGSAISAAVRQTPRVNWQQAAVSPDGSKLALYSTSGVTIYDLSSGRILRQLNLQSWFFSISPNIDRRLVTFLDDDRLAFVQRRSSFEPFNDVAVYSISRNSKNLLPPAKVVAGGAPSLQGNTTLSRREAMHFDLVTRTVETRKFSDETTRSFTVQSSLGQQLFKVSPGGRWIIMGEDYSIKNKSQIIDADDGQLVALVNGTPHSMWFFDDDKKLLVETADKDFELFSIDASAKPAIDKTDANLIASSLPEAEATSELDLTEFDLNLAHPANIPSQSETSDPQSLDQESADTITPVKKWLAVKPVWQAKHRGFWFNRSLDTATKVAQDGSRLAFWNRPSDEDEVIVVDAATGESLARIKKPNDSDSVGSFLLSPDGKRLILTPEYSDWPIEVFDVDSQTLIKSFGRNWRLSKGIIFTLLFAGWAFAWGRFGHSTPEQVTSRRISEFDDPEEAGVVIGEVVEGGAAHALAYHSPDQINAPFTVTLVWIMLSVGGFWAVGLSVIPMFYFQNNPFVNFLPVLGVLRYVWAGLGIFVGVMAMSRGLTARTSGLRLPAILQLTNVLNVDVINVLLGVVELVLLDSKSAREYLKATENK